MVWLWLLVCVMATEGSSESAVRAHGREERKSSLQYNHVIKITKDDENDKVIVFAFRQMQ